MRSNKYSGKIFYTIGEVAAMMDLKTHVLRYWESEFPALKPQKRANGRRAYRESDIEIVRTIRRLLYDEGYTIAGAKKKLAEQRRKRRPRDGEDVVVFVKEELRQILAVLK